MRLAICICVVTATLIGCGSRATSTVQAPTPSRTTRAATTKPILYHRTGGIAGTDDRVVIWPDGLVVVSGKILPDAEGRIDSERLDGLRRAFADWDQLKETYLASEIADAYLITISYGEKTIEASDLAPNLPETFRRIFTEIEAIAAAAQSTEPQAQP